MEDNSNELKRQQDKEDLKKGLFTINLYELVIIGLLCFVFISDYSFDLYDSKESCISRWKNSEQTVKYTKQSGCTVKINNTWVKEDNITYSIN